MLRKLLDYQLSFFEKGKKLHRLRPAVSALDAFLYEAPINTSRAPHIRDAVDLKRWMVLVVIALIPCILMAIWNTGMQKLVYASGDAHLMEDYLSSSTSLSGYFDFAFKDNHWISILQYGLAAFLPIVIISYAVGGLWEMLFAIIRGHEIAEGFLVTGILYALILPATIPYWMVAVGVSFGVIVSKELFGGTGMNILNPALTCRVFLFFTFPGQMTGEIWAGTNPVKTAQSLKKMNAESGLPSWDGFTQATPLSKYKAVDEIKRVHVDAIASNAMGTDVPTIDVIDRQFDRWQAAGHSDASFGSLSGEQLHEFVTAGFDKGGLGLSPDNYDAAYRFASLNYGVGHDSDWHLFLGDRLGSMGETSILACLLGAVFLIWMGVGAWRTMVAVGLSAFITALLFQLGAEFFGADSGAWNPARLALPAYKHLLVGSLAFGLVFMATEPVSAPYMNSAKWVYGALIGFLTIAIRTINPAYPEGVMLSILFANVFAPLIDHYAVRRYRRKQRVRPAAATS